MAEKCSPRRSPSQPNTEALLWGSRGGEDTCPRHGATYLADETCTHCGAPPCCAPCPCEEDDS